MNESRESNVASLANELASHRSIPLPRMWQWALLVPILLHVLAVFSEPYHFFSRSEIVPEAADARFLRAPLQSYTQFMYLDHGYFFFAPNPGPGHLLRISASPDPITVPEEVVTADDVRVIQFPDRRTMWPRLLYHRFFMLSEFYYSRFAPIELSEELRQDPGFVERWQRDRKLYTSLQSSISDHVKKSTGQSFVRIDRLERALPDRTSVLQKGVSISDSQWVSVLRESLDASPPPNAGMTPMLPGGPGPGRNAREPVQPMQQPPDTQLLPLSNPTPESIATPPKSNAVPRQGEQP